MSTQERRTIQVGNIKIRLQSRTNLTTTTPKKAIQESLATKPKQPRASTGIHQLSSSSKATSKPLACIHRDKAIGKIDCGCRGMKAVHHCKVCVRPNTTPTQPAFCTDYKLVRYFGIILDDGTKLRTSDVPQSEIIVCNQQHCDQYSPVAQA